MKPLRAEFLISAPNLASCPAVAGPEVAFVGRSNAGKSSVLNRLTGTRNLARVSRTPGRTQLINFFDVNGGGRLVDLPGYGYAAAPKQQQEQWQRHIDDYLSNRPPLAGVVLIMDSRHPLKESDQILIDWARQSAMPLLILLNKVDKLGKNARQKTLSQVTRQLPQDATMTTLLFSAQNGDGLDQALQHIRIWLQPTARGDQAQHTHQV